MKKIPLLLAVAAFSLISCKKKYTCTCVDTNSNGQIVQTTNESLKDYPSDAKTACGFREGTFDENVRSCSVSEVN